MGTLPNVNRVKKGTPKITPWSSFVISYYFIFLEPYVRALPCQILHHFIHRLHLLRPEGIASAEQKRMIGIAFCGID